MTWTTLCNVLLGAAFFLNGFSWYFGDSDMKDKNDVHEKNQRRIIGLLWFALAFMVGL